MKNILLSVLIIFTSHSTSAAWLTSVEESIFDESSAILIGEISNSNSFMLFECKGRDLYFSYVEESNDSNIKKTPITLLFKVDNNTPIQFNASLQRRNPDYVEAITSETESILNALYQLRAAKSKYMSGIAVKATDFRASFSGNVYKSTVSANSFIQACGINENNNITETQANKKELNCSESLKKNNTGKLTSVITNRAMGSQSICYNGKNVTQEIADSMEVAGDVDENLRVSSWLDNKTNKLYVSFYNEATGDVNLDIAYLDKNKRIKTTRNFIKPQRDMPDRDLETKFSFSGDAKGSNGDRWLYFNAIEATNIFSYRINLSDKLSLSETTKIDFFSNGGVYKIWDNGNVSVETSWIDDSKGRLLGGEVKDSNGKFVCELETNDQEIPVEKQKCK